MSFTPTSNKYVSPDKSRKSVSSKRNSINNSGKRDSMMLSNHVRRPSKLKSEDLKNLSKLPEKKVKEIEFSKETKKLIKTNKLSASKTNYNTSNPQIEKVNLAHELEDPANEYLRNDIQKMIQMENEVSTLSIEYQKIEAIQQDMKDEIAKLMKNDTKSNVKYLVSSNCK